MFMFNIRQSDLTCWRFSSPAAPGGEMSWNFFGSGGNSDDDEQEDTEQGLLRDWQDFKEAEPSGWTSWNPLARSQSVD